MLEGCSVIDYIPLCCHTSVGKVLAAFTARRSVFVKGSYVCYHIVRAKKKVLQLNSKTSLIQNAWDQKIGFQIT